MAASTAFTVPSQSLKPATSYAPKNPVFSQLLIEFNQRTDWGIALVADIGLVLAGATPYPAAGLPLVFAGNITTLSTSTATFGGPFVVNGVASINNNLTVGVTGTRRTVLVQGVISELGSGSSIPAAAAVAAGVLTVPLQSVGGLSSPAMFFSVPNAGAPTNITTIADPTGFTLAAGAKLMLKFGAIASNNYTLTNAGNMAVNGGSISIAGAVAPLIPAGSTSVLIGLLYDGAKWQMTDIAGTQ